MFILKASLWLVKSRNVDWKFSKNFITHYWLKQKNEKYSNDIKTWISCSNLQMLKFTTHIFDIILREYHQPKHMCMHIYIYIYIYTFTHHETYVQTQVSARLMTVQIKLLWLRTLLEFLIWFWPNSNLWKIACLDIWLKSSF